MTKQEAIRRLYGLIADINAEEVADHIKDGVSLCDWTNLWRCEAKDVLRILEDTADASLMDEAKRKRYIKALENVLKSEEMSICHEAFLTEEAIKEILGILKEKNGQWTPCDERMPNEDGYYLVTVEFDYGKEIEMGWLLDGEWVNENSHVTVAWMPLPEVWENNDE